MTGGVKSNLSRVDRSLPEGSYYMPINEEFKYRVTYSQAVGMSNRLFAKRAVDKVLGRGIVSRIQALLTFGGSRRWIWEGSRVGQVWMMTQLLPRMFAERIFARMFHLWKLRGTADLRKVT